MGEFDDLDPIHADERGEAVTANILSILKKVDSFSVRRGYTVQVHMQWKEMELLLRAIRGEYEYYDLFCRLLPIFLRRKPPASIIKFLLDAVPDAARREANKLPLHVAVCHGASAKVILMLIEAFPEATIRQDLDGFTPVHKATKTEQQRFTFEYTNKKGNVTWEAVKVLRGLLKGTQDVQVLRAFLQRRRIHNYEHNHLYAFFATLSTDNISETQFNSGDPISIDFNKTLFLDWTILEIIVARDIEFASRIFFFLQQELTNFDFSSQRRRGENCTEQAAQHLCCMVYHLSNSVPSQYGLFRVKPLAPVSRKTWRKVANRAALSSVKDLREWGQSYGRLFGRYLIDSEETPKHVSDTCLVIFANELRDGRDTKVALKFMTDVKAFSRELYHRNRIFAVDVNAHKHIVDVSAAYTSCRSIDCRLADSSGRDFVHFAQNFDDLVLFTGANIEMKSGGKLRHMLVMECGTGQDLRDLISHQNIANKDLNLVCHIAINIAEHLQYLNETMGMIHGDVKDRNFVLFGIGIQIRAVDFDNASTIDGEGLVGEKRTSSGCLPPEQAAVEYSLRNPGYAQDRDEEISKVRSEIKGWEETLQECSDEKTRLLIKREVTDLKQQLQNLENRLTPGRVVATPQHDMWCFGLLLYRLCAGKPLFQMDEREWVEDPELKVICDWSVDLLDEKCCSFMNNPGWRSLWLLLRNLLQRRKEDRPRNWSMILKDLRKIGTSGGKELEGDGLQISNDLLAEWRENTQTGAFVFICHRGPDTKYSIAWPTYWFLTEILKVSAFLDQPSLTPSKDTHRGISRGVYQCTHALILFSPGFRESIHPIRELETLLQRRRSEPICLIPALWQVENLDEYAKDLQGTGWLVNRPGFVDPAYYVVEVLWPYMAKTVPHGQGDYGRDDFVRLLLQYVSESETAKREIPFLDSDLLRS